MDAGTAKKLIEKNLSYDEVKRLTVNDVIKRDAKLLAKCSQNVRPFRRYPDQKSNTAQRKWNGSFTE